ncbi:hypothetical protein D3C80_1763300 [compost metagenome]
MGICIEPEHNISQASNLVNDAPGSAWASAPRNTVWFGQPHLSTGGLMAKMLLATW